MSVRGEPRGRSAPRILFRVAAGPRIGSGHLVRASRLAALVGVPVHVSVRGRRAASLLLRSSIAWEPDAGATTTMARVRPSLLVVDDPSVAASRTWVAEARRRGCPVVALVDFGIGASAADLAIDGSVARSRRARSARHVLHGPAFAITDPRITSVSHRSRRAAAPEHVFISLGGGYRTRYACRIARELRRAGCGLPLVIAGGFTSTRTCAGDHVKWLGPQPTLVPWLAPARVAIVAGGITLYESCALRVPTVAVALVRAQRPPVEAMARRRAVTAVTTGDRVPPDPAMVARRVISLLGQRLGRDSTLRRGPSIVDGRGPWRVARILRWLASGRGVESVVARVRPREGEVGA